MTAPNIVDRETWLKHRQELLKREKDFTRERDALSQARQEMPWVEVAEDYVFENEQGPIRLSELFNGRSQLVVYHFMYGPEWEVGCKSCSFWADGYNGLDTHLAARDVSLIAVSRTSLDNIRAFKERMGWSFTWVSSLGNNFNFDYQVSFTEEERESGSVTYNYRQTSMGSDEMPGVSVFVKDKEGKIYHSYSTYSRGLDLMNSAYNILDMVPKGRDEADLPYSMAWVQLHDTY